MDTTLSHSVADLKGAEEQITVIQYLPKEKTYGPVARTLRSILHWLGVLFTVAWGLAALAPNTFNIPAGLQGWAFFISILWFFAFCTGFFNL